ncbi:PE family protein [Mycolicibacter heraklionensis]|uniref:PE family protein n=1 Tax=Mycolicibacter heraklionensis TaxID=512402 RepID=A0A9X7WGB7_9MYCO|nr:PE family protein [Mycolicibacter heraklionensis]KLO29092.1 PE family protein [Mycolicibacter heraklionensis]QZA07748.1 PE family protein [Mycolicibacter heraklionensis]
MSFVSALPEELAATAADLRGVGYTVAAQSAAAAAPTTGVIPAAADEVSVLTAAQFARHAQVYQAISKRAAAVHETFVNTLQRSAQSYAATDAANVISFY